MKGGGAPGTWVRAAGGGGGGEVTAGMGMVGGMGTGGGPPAVI